MMAKAKKTAAPARIPAEEIPYTVPANWRWVRLGSINQYEGDNVEPSAQSDTIFELYSVPCYEQKYPEIVAGEKIGSAKKSVKKNDVLLCKINPRINRVWKVEQYTEHPLIASGEWAIIRNPDIFADYLMRYFQAPVFRKYLLSNVSGVGGSLMRARPKFIDIYPVPLPPRVEQERIVACIEELFEKLDAAEEKLRAVVEGSPARRAALLRRAFTGDLTASWRAANGRTMDTWEEKKLGDCGTWQGGGTPSKSHPEYWENGDLLWVTSKDMKAKIIEDTQLHINQKGVENSSATYVEKPSLLFVMRSGILRHTLPVAMVKKPFTVNQDLKVLTPDSDELEFLYWACKAHADDIRSTCMKSGTTVESISAPALMNYKIPVPPLDEQKEIVRLLDELLAQEDAARAAAEATLAKIPALRQAVLTRAFRGQLGTNDPADPPALSE